MVATEPSVRVMCPGAGSGGDAERTFDEAHLTDGVGFWQPANLTFADNVHCPVSHDRVQSAINGPEPLAGHDSLLQETMIRFNHIIDVR